MAFILLVFVRLFRRADKHHVMKICSASLHWNRQTLPAQLRLVPEESLTDQP